MIIMGYNTEQQIRDALGMAATTPSSAQIVHWQTLIDAMIVQANAEVVDSIAAIVEMNRIGRLFNARKKISSADKWKDQEFDTIPPLSPSEKSLIQGDDDQVDALPMNGARYTNSFGRY